MIELEPQAYKQVLPFYMAQKKSLFPLILAVIQNKQAGRVFVDDILNPSSVLVIHKFGFMQVFGVEGADRFDADLADFFSIKREDVPSYLLWYSPPQRWQLKLDRLENGLVRKRERARFVYYEQSPDLWQDVSAGYDVQLLDKVLLKKTDDFNLNISSRFWSSVDDFLKNGVGVCLLQDNQIVSLCYSACIVNGMAEVDVITRDGYQGQGLATIVAQRFIQECVRKKIMPTWDCFMNNTASVKLAEKLGFSETETYFFYSFNIPIVFLTSNDIGSVS